MRANSNIDIVFKVGFFYFCPSIIPCLIVKKRPPGIMGVLDDACSTLHAVTEGAEKIFMKVIIIIIQ